MNDLLNKPKDFGQVLDLTFRICKNHFSRLFMILFIVLGPIYLIQVIILFFAGTHFFHELSPTHVFMNQLNGGNLDSDFMLNSSATAGEGIAFLFVTLATAILFPVTRGGILIAVNELKNNRDFATGAMIKRAFSRFWPILGSSILFGLIITGMMVGVGLVSFIVGAIISTFSKVLGIFIGIVIALGLIVVTILLAIRWSLFLGSVVVDRESPGLSRSWRLTSKRTWKILGFFIVVGIITGIINYAIAGVVNMLLGGSILSTIVTDLVDIVTGMISAVAYALIYHDMKVRHDGDDLQNMIEDYQNPNEPTY